MEDTIQKMKEALALDQDNWQQTVDNWWSETHEDPAKAAQLKQSNSPGYRRHIEISNRIRDSHLKIYPHWNWLVPFELSSLFSSLESELSELYQRTTDKTLRSWILAFVVSDSLPINSPAHVRYQTAALAPLIAELKDLPSNLELKDLRWSNHQPDTLEATFALFASTMLAVANLPATPQLSAPIEQTLNCLLNNINWDPTLEASPMKTAQVLGLSNADVCNVLLQNAKSEELDPFDLVDALELLSTRQRSPTRDKSPKRH